MLAFSNSCLFPRLLQLIITHITARNAHVRQLLAAQGLILRQATSAADSQSDSGLCMQACPTLLRLI